MDANRILIQAIYKLCERRVDSLDLDRIHRGFKAVYRVVEFLLLVEQLHLRCLNDPRVKVFFSADKWGGKNEGDKRFILKALGQGLCRLVA